MMRTSLMSVASVALVASLSACSDGSGPLGNGGASGAATTPGGGSGPTAGNTGNNGGSANPGGGMPPAGGMGGIGGNVLPPGGMGGSGGGGPPMGGTGGGGTDAYSGPFKMLVVTQTLDFPHDSIDICKLMVGIESVRGAVEADRGKAQPPNLGVTPDAMMPAGTKPGSQFTAELATNDLAHFTDEKLKDYGVVFFCNPTGTVFSANPSAGDSGPAAMAAFQKYIESGGGWAGVHSATDFEKQNGFPWFTNTLVGAYFDHHDPDRTSGTVQAQSDFLTHPVLTGIPVTWSAQDEWYYMNRDVSSQPGFQILSRLVSDQRPVAWVKELGTNGRSFYTIRGHNKSVFEEDDFRKLVLNGILWAAHRLE